NADETTWPPTSSSRTTRNGSMPMPRRRRTGPKRRRARRRTITDASGPVEGGHAVIPAAARRTNPGLLKLDLYCRGARLDDSCFIEGDGGRRVLRTRAGLGSGLELILPGGLWTNVPVNENFVKASPYSLRRAPREKGGYELLRRGERVCPVALS